MWDWKFEPDEADVKRCRGVRMPCIGGEHWRTETQAIWHGKEWLRETNGQRTGTISAVKAQPRTHSYIWDY